MSLDQQSLRSKTVRDATRHYPVLHYSWNNDNGILEDVTYTPYTDDEIRDLGRNPKEIGELGSIKGVVRCGGQFSRLFHVTHNTPWPIGKRITFDWFTADKDVRENKDGTFSYVRCTCG